MKELRFRDEPELHFLIRAFYIMKNLILFIKKNKIILAIIATGLFLRAYLPAQLFLYGHDQDLAGWVIKDVVVNKHIRLIGQETSTQGIFIGPLFYYLLIPFYLVFNMDPTGGVVLVAILGVFTIWSLYFVFARIFSKNVGLIAAFLYAVSFYTIFNDREIVPTMPVITWSVWYFYAMNLLLKGKQRFVYPLLGVLLGLIWHINFALALLLPLILIAAVLSKKRIDGRALGTGVVTLFITSLPLVIFELRHGFLQTKALYVSLTTPQHAIVSGFEKLRRVVHLSSKNVSGLVWGDLSWIKYEVLAAFLILVFVFLAVRKVITKKQTILISVWLLIYISFFSLYSKVVSEYYLNGMLVIWITILTLGISYLFSKKSSKKYGAILLAIFALININRFFSISINRSGYLERKAVVAEIKRDADVRGFPCVAVSYITNPGYELGYRYFYWLENMHVNHSESQSPVYTVVFPLKPIFPVHKTFGAIGLIYPDYPRYTKEGIEESCSGENSNLTDPMFGYTQ